jgi:uncharacterized protein (DUF1015 family)
MPLIRPFAALRPLASYAAKVIAPPYDVLSSDEARLQALYRPWSFLHISKPEIDLPIDTYIYDDAVYAKGAENLNNMIANKILQQDNKACYYLYRLIMGEHEQIGLVCVASVIDYDSNRIRKHEFTRPDKEDDRVRQIDALDAQTGPVFLTYKHQTAIDELVANLTQTDPLIDLTADDGVRHSLWVVDNDEHIAFFSTQFDTMPYLYIADGHHRSAAASRVAAKRKAQNPNHNGEESYNYFLSVIFPDNQVKILDYNRVITDLNGLSTNEFLTEVGRYFHIETVEAHGRASLDQAGRASLDQAGHASDQAGHASDQAGRASDQAYKPSQPAEFSMYLQQQWYKLKLHNSNLSSDPVKRLDVSLLADNLIAPILNITDPRRDKRIDFVGGIRGLQELERRVNSGEMQVAFALYPTSLADLMAVADANQVMPPKSTWFEPKLADGLVSHKY